MRIKQGLLVSFHYIEASRRSYDRNLFKEPLVWLVMENVDKRTIVMKRYLVFQYLP